MSEFSTIGNVTPALAAAEGQYKAPRVAGDTAVLDDRYLDSEKSLGERHLELLLWLMNLELRLPPYGEPV